MSTLTITDYGIQAAANAQEGGFLIDVARFQVSNHAFTDEELADTSILTLPDTVLYEGGIETIEVLNADSVRFTMYLPSAVPATGTWALNSVGIFLESGELFAFGKLEPAYTKDNTFAFRFIVVLSMARLGDVVNINWSDVHSIPSVGFVYQLPDPKTIDQNFVAVLDQMFNPDRSVSPGGAFKYGPGNDYWGFTGHDRLYYDRVKTVSTDKYSFTLDMAEAGFQLALSEVVIANVGVGPARGISRRVQYLGDGVFQELDGKPFISSVTGSFDQANTFVAIWRNSSVNRPANLTIPLPRNVVYIANGTDTVCTLPATPTGQDYVIAHVDGIPTTVTIKGKTAVFDTAPEEGSVIDLWMLDFTGDFENKGTVFEVKHYEFANNGKVYYDIDEDIADINQVFVYVGGQHLQRNADYRLGVKKVVLAVPADAPYINVTVLNKVERRNTNTEMVQHSIELTSYVGEVYADEATASGNGLLYLDSVPQASDDFSISANLVTFKDTSISKGSVRFIEFREEPQYLTETTPFIKASLLGTNLTFKTKAGTTQTVDMSPLITSGAQGPMGPAGPEGPAGAPGIAGADGVDGKDGMAIPYATVAQIQEGTAGDMYIRPAELAQANLGIASCGVFNGQDLSDVRYANTRKNVGTIIKLGTGIYAVTFATPMKDKYYAVAFSAYGDANQDIIATFAGGNAKTADGFTFVTVYPTSTNRADSPEITFIVTET